MADFQVSVKADHSHGDEAATAEEEAGPAVEATALPAEQPAVGKTGNHKERLSCDCGDENKAWAAWLTHKA